MTIIVRFSKASSIEALLIHCDGAFSSFTELSFIGDLVFDHNIRRTCPCPLFRSTIYKELLCPHHNRMCPCQGASAPHCLAPRWSAPRTQMSRSKLQCCSVRVPPARLRPPR